MALGSLCLHRVTFPYKAELLYTVFLCLETGWKGNYNEKI